MDKFKQMTFSGLREDDPSRKGPFTISLTIDKIFIYAIIALIVIVLIFSLGVEQGKKIAAQKFEHSLLQMAGSMNPPAQPAVPEAQPASSSPVPVAVNAGSAAEKTTVPVPSQTTEAVFATAVEKTAPVQKTAVATPPGPVQKEAKAESKPAVKSAVKPAAVKEPPVQNTGAPAKRGTFYFIQVMSYSNEPEAQKLTKVLKGEGFPAYVNPRGKFYAVVVGNFGQKGDAEKTLASLKKKYKDCFIRRKES